MHARLLASFCVLFAAAAGCVSGQRATGAGGTGGKTGTATATGTGIGGTGTTGTGTTGTGTTGTGTTTGTTTTGTGTTTGSGAGGAGAGCSPEAKLLYVLGAGTGQGTIWSFSPDTKQFVDLFDLDCPLPADGNTWGPNSMAVDRTLTAWVNYAAPSATSPGDVAGVLFQVDLTNKTCAPTPSVTLASPWYRVGMGFASDAPGSMAETLYVFSDEGSATLGRISAGTVLTIGPLTGDALLTGQNADLCGNGAGRLFGFFTTSPYARVAGINPATGAILSDYDITGVAPPASWAFSYWGGAFYLFTSVDGVQSSTVTRYDAATMQVDSTYVLTAPMVIVGAGASTCAPTM
jgi:hypothetical protein